MTSLTEMDNEQQLISTKVRKSSLARKKICLSTRKEVTLIENSERTKLNPKPLNFLLRYNSLNTNNKINKPDQYAQFSLSNEKDKDIISTQTNTIESFYDSKKTSNTFLRYPTFYNKQNPSNKASIPLEKLKSIKKNIFAIDPEDQIFNKLNAQSLRKTIKKKKAKKIPLSCNEAKIKSIYKSTKDSKKKISLLKKHKNRYTLLGYQTQLLNLSKNDISNEAMLKLERTFCSLRAICNKEYETNQSALCLLEEKECKIIKRVNYQNNAISNLLNRSERRKEGDRLKLPELKFIQVFFNSSKAKPKKFALLKKTI